MFDLVLQPHIDKTFMKLAKKDPELLKLIWKKICEIQKGTNVYKYLRKPLNSFNRVHIGKQSVLIFKVNYDLKIVTLYKFGHHDEIYKWQPDN